MIEKRKERKGEKRGHRGGWDLLLLLFIDEKTLQKKVQHGTSKSKSQKICGGVCASDLLPLTRSMQQQNSDLLACDALFAAAGADEIALDGQQHWQQ